MANITVESVQPGKLREISSLADAASFLLSEWPNDYLGPAHSLARLACAAALDGHQSASSARKAFIDAAQDADIHVECGPNGVTALIEQFKSS